MNHHSKNVRCLYFSDIHRAHSYNLLCPMPVRACSESYQLYVLLHFIAMGAETHDRATGRISNAGRISH